MRSYIHADKWYYIGARTRAVCNAERENRQADITLDPCAIAIIAMMINRITDTLECTYNVC